MLVNQNTECFDFPSLGVDERAVLVTLNIASGGGGSTPCHGLPSLTRSIVIALPKAQLFAIPPSFPLPAKGFHTNPRPVPLVTPPIVRGSATRSYFVAPVSRASTDPAGPAQVLKLYDLGDTAADLNSWTFTGPRDVALPSHYQYVVPYPAIQCVPGTFDPNTGDREKGLDASDTRFVNASTQVTTPNGISLWQVHTVNRAVGDKVPAPRWYELDPASNPPSVRQAGQLSAGPGAEGLNASLTADAANNVFVTWTSVAGVYPNCMTPQVRFSGRRATDLPEPVGQPGNPAGMSSGGYLPWPEPSSPSTSPRNYTPTDSIEAWGDYSAVSIDPSTQSRARCPGTFTVPPLRAWVINEKATQQTTVWGSQVGSIGFC